MAKTSPLASTAADFPTLSPLSLGTSGLLVDTLRAQHGKRGEPFVGKWEAVRLPAEGGNSERLNVDTKADAQSGNAVVCAFDARGVFLAIGTEAGSVSTIIMSRRIPSHNRQSRLRRFIFTISQ